MRGSPFVMAVRARFLQLQMGVFGRIPWVGMRLESFLAEETRASGLPIPLPTARALVGADGVSAVTHTTTCGGTMIKQKHDTPAVSRLIVLKLHILSPATKLSQPLAEVICVPTVEVQEFGAWCFVTLDGQYYLSVQIRRTYRQTLRK